MCKSTLSSSLRPGEHLRALLLDVANATSCLCLGQQGDVLEPHLEATTPPSLSQAALLLPPRSLSPSRCARSQYRSSNRHGCHLGSPFRASPSPADVLRSSVASLSSSPSKESTSTAWSRCRFTRIPHRSQARRCQNPPPPALLRPSQPCRSTPGESPVWPEPSPRLAARPSATHGRPPACLGAGRLGNGPGRPGQAGQSTWPRGPQSFSVGQNALGTKSLQLCFKF
jgi:hypothetical protein